MDLKEPGNLLYQIGATHDELGGSHYSLVESLAGGRSPRVDAKLAKRTFAALHSAIDAGLVRACHDLSEGGLAAAAAEMAFAGGLGAKLDVERVVCGSEAAKHAAALLFSESNTRFLCEVKAEDAGAFEARFRGDVPCACIGQVVAAGKLEFVNGAQPLITAELSTLKSAWQTPLKW
jgi:phosphoribosylformylglycinamidine synthase